MALTNDPEAARQSGTKPNGEQELYVVLSEEERAKGFVRPLRFAYKHIGPPAPRFQLVDLTEEQREEHEGRGYVKYEPYPESERPSLGRFWTQDQLDGVLGGCGVVTTMNTAIAETYARDPSYYGGTFCAGCKKHFPVAEFLWDGTDQVVGS